MPSLAVESGKDKGLAVELSDDRVFLIGRGSSCDLHLSDTLTSRRHCWVECRDRKFILKDGGSRNGSFLNGRRVSEAELMPGDQILVGETLITFQAEALASADPLIGKDVGGYRILELIGKGGMGRVYKAMQISLERVVAIKILSRQYAANAAFIERFRREAMALAKLTHPNIVAVYDVGDSGGLHYFSMEYMAGGTVADKISGGRKLPAEEAILMMMDIARGLTYAEEQGVVHRDIKPENMMLDHAGNVKICDLGIAHTISEGPWRNTPHGVFGSPHYIAPEQARGQATDHRADIYSLGASFYRILAGKTLFTGGSARELILKHINEKPTPIAQLEPTLPPSVCNVIDKCLAKGLFSRYQSAGKVVEDLELALQHVRQAIEARERAARTRKRRRGSRGILKVIVVLVILCSAAAAYLAVRHPEETRQFMDRVTQWVSAHMEAGSTE
ncbi:MAG TPA: FHA domain-containing serine/threonine-protein kinase [Planctomycetota bacterium]|nr:FHA domain-containing serine/threonine-protein kinase [Planctomycetota bacterium]